ncbi:MAG TPA: PLD nuclease N-terminal domain-containing protein [Anaerolineales bacterium]|nr:PLD nuclease N-terminal domain-containing protein [Anaerolineales bacterium]
MDTEQLLRLLPLIAPLVVIQLGLMLAGLLDLRRRERTRGPKWLWALIVVFFGILGPVIYFLVGREEA